MKRVLLFTVVMLCLSGFAWADVVTINGGSYQNTYPGGAAYVNNGDDVTATAADFDGNSNNSSGGIGFVNRAGTLTANNCTFEGQVGIANYDTATIDSGNITGGVTNSGNMTINGATITSLFSNTNGNMTINSGSFSDNGTITVFQNNSDSTTTINGGDFSSNDGAIYGVMNYGTDLIYGGSSSGIM